MTRPWFGEGQTLNLGFIPASSSTSRLAAGRFPLGWGEGDDGRNARDGASIVLEREFRGNAALIFRESSTLGKSGGSGSSHMSSNLVFVLIPASVEDDNGGDRRIEVAMSRRDRTPCRCLSHSDRSRSTPGVLGGRRSGLALSKSFFKLMPSISEGR